MGEIIVLGIFAFIAWQCWSEGKVDGYDELCNELHYRAKIEATLREIEVLREYENTLYEQRE